MNRLALFVALGLLAGAAHGTTFELSDPANEMYREQEEKEKERAAKLLEANAFCSIDPDSDECSCIDRESGRALSLTWDQCIDRVIQQKNQPDS
jgi:hypothetical protein